MREFSLLLDLGANLFIGFGYLMLMAAVAPERNMPRSSLKIAGAGFFLFCAATHFDKAFHMFSGTTPEYGTLEHLVIHVPQAGFVAAVIYLLIVRGDSPKVTFGAPKDEDRGS